MSGILEGVKVIDFTRVISGPTTTQYLADMGAVVIKVEPPETGEVMRNITPLKNGQSGFFITLNRGKKSITLDLKSREGRKIALRLIEWADVVVENFSPGTMAHLGLGYDTAKEKNPKIIYASLSGYGQTGPNSRLPSYDLCVQAMSGLMQMNGFPDKPPCRIGVSVTDYVSGMILAMGILGALYHRQRTGEGQSIDVSMFDSGLSFLENAITRYDMAGEVAQPVGSAHPAASPHNVYETRDGYITLIVIEDGAWGRLCDAMGRPELKKDAQIGKALSRIKHSERVDSIVESWTKAWTTEELITILTAHHLPYGVVKDAKSLIDDPHVLARDMIVEVDQPGCGKVRIPGNPIKYSAQEAKTEVRGPAPAVGQHNKEVLCDLIGYSEEEFERFLDAHVL